MIDAMKIGNEVEDPTKMKQKQLVTNLAGFLVGILCTWIKGKYPEFAIFEYQDLLTGLFVSALGAINYYFTVASTRKIGIVG